MISKFEFCEDCKKSNTPGFVRDGYGSVKECECLLNYSKIQSFYSLLKSKGIPQSFIDYDINSYVGNRKPKEIIKILENIDLFVKNGLQCYFSGEPNTQKTSIATYIIKKALIKKFNVYYTTMANILSLLRKEYKASKESYEENLIKIDWYQDCDLLVIDDAFDLTKVYLSVNSENEQINLLTLLKKRILNGKSNIYVSNVRRSNINFGIFNSCFSDILSKDCQEIFFEDSLPKEIINKKILSFFSERIHAEVRKKKQKE